MQQSPCHGAIVPLDVLDRCTMLAMTSLTAATRLAGKSLFILFTLVCCCLLYYHTVYGSSFPFCGFCSLSSRCPFRPQLSTISTVNLGFVGRIDEGGAWDFLFFAIPHALWSLVG